MILISLIASYQLMDIEGCIRHYKLIEIQNGTLVGQNSKSSYRIVAGHSHHLANLADIRWMMSYRASFEEVIELNKPKEEEQKILDSIIMEDIHWSWFRKSSLYNSSEYEWFYLVADQNIQGVCVIYHPKVSNLETGNIFYVEYVSVAPWNRSTMLNDKQYEKIGTKLLNAASEYACNQLKLKPGFSLHSLPQSETYYQRIGMIEIPAMVKDNLKYYEMNKSTNEKWRASNV